MADNEVIAAILTAGMQARLGEYKKWPEGTPRVQIAPLPELIAQQYQLNRHTGVPLWLVAG